jgi:hypothetical protein
MRLRALLCLALLTAMPARAEIFWGRPPVENGVLTGPTTGYGFPLPGANPAEQKAWLIWNLRSGLNVAALQCGRHPMLFTESNYNAMLTNHGAELDGAFKTLTAYFKRVNKTTAAGQKALDSFGTRTYSSFSAVSGIQIFCTIAGDVGGAARFTPRASLNTLASERLTSLFSAVKSTRGEQAIRRASTLFTPRLPNLDDRCWKKTKYNPKCG